MIKAVTFDLWHTLIYEPDETYIQRTRMIRMRETWKALKENGHQISYDEVKVAYHVHDFMLEEIWSKWEDVAERTHIRMLLDALGIKKGRKELYEVLKTPYGDALLKNMPALTEGIDDTLRILKEDGLSLGLISNTGRTAGRGMKEVLDRLGILHHFDALTFSSDMKIRKPQSNIFNRTLGSMDVKPKNAAHVGDDVVTDVWASRKAGMKGILYDKDGRGDLGRKVDAIIHNFDELQGALRMVGRKR
ncbi:MAG: HAD family hydrolase [Thermoplasmata archaeon]|nr:HAD family hydrolase [Thermoplasmata archaeon]